MNDKTEYLRLFYAIELPQAVKKSIECLCSKYNRFHDPVKWTNPANLHLTLRFLGNVEQNRLSGLRMILDNICTGKKAFVYSLCGMGCFPNTKRPSVIWVGCEQGCQNVIRIANELENNITRMGFKKQQRAFKPHITIGRVKSHNRKGLSADFMRELDNNKESSLGSFTVTNISLIKSVLTREGPIYTTLHTASLD